MRLSELFHPDEMETMKIRIWREPDYPRALEVEIMSKRRNGFSFRYETVFVFDLGHLELGRRYKKNWYAT